MREDRLRLRVAVNLEKSRRTVGHREWATVQRRRWSEEIEARELIDARMRAMSAFIGGGHDSFSGRDVVELVPGITGFDPIDAASPGIVRDMSRRRCFCCFTQRQNIRSRAMAEPVEVRLDLSEHLRGQSPAKVRAEKRVVVVLVAEPWRILKELGHKAFGSSLAGEAHHVPKLTHWPSAATCNRVASMCGRATVINPDGITEKLYGYTRKFVPHDWKPRYNLNPHEDIPAVYYDPFLSERALRTMHWNLIPSKLESRHNVVEFDSQYSTFNARIETVASAPTFEQSWRTQRCLVVVDGIIEWVGEKRRKIPHLIRHKDRIPFAMAGLWSRWRDSVSDEEMWSCT